MRIAAFLLSVGLVLGIQPATHHHRLHRCPPCVLVCCPHHKGGAVS